MMNSFQIMYQNSWALFLAKFIDPAFAFVDSVAFMYVGTRGELNKELWSLNEHCLL